MSINFRGKVFTAHELEKLSTAKFMEIFKEKKLDYQKFGGYLFKDRKIIINELIRREKFFAYTYEELVNLDYIAIGDLCEKEKLIPNDKVIYDYSKTELIRLITEKYAGQYVGEVEAQNLKKGNKYIY